MAKGKAYCEETKSEVTIDEARVFYFKQPEPRKKLTFYCGDQLCRAITKATVIGENYHKPDDSYNKNKSPCFRRNPHQTHIVNCSWVRENTQSEKSSTDDSDANKVRAGAAVEAQGLIFRPFPKGKVNNSVSRLPYQDTEGLNGNNAQQKQEPSGDTKKKSHPETSRFMPAVAIRHLSYSDEQRRKTALHIARVADGSFHDVCIPIVGFHPYYQVKRIYFGLCDIASLTNVFFVRFRNKMSASGDRDNRTMIAEIKLNKSRLSGEDAMLMKILEELAKTKKNAWCYFYSESLPQESINGDRRSARFDVSDINHISIVPEAVLINSPLVAANT